ALSAELDLVVHIHVLETKMQALLAHERYGVTFPRHLCDIGFLTERVNFEHGIWLTDDDIDLMKEFGVTLVYSPASNLKLGSGVGPVPLIAQKGVNVALSSDGMNANDGTDMLATLKLAGLVQKIWEIDYDHWPGSSELWAMATRNGAVSAGDTCLGTIEA